MKRYSDATPAVKPVRCSQALNDRFLIRQRLHLTGLRPRKSQVSVASRMKRHTMLDIGEISLIARFT